MTRVQRIVVIHPSDEMYGADRMLLQVLAGLSAIERTDIEVWLPTDVPHGAHPLCRELTRCGFAWRHVRLPILRRAYMRPRGLLALRRTMRWLRRELQAHAPDLVYCGTSASLLCAPIARRVGVPHRVVHIQERWTGKEALVLRWLARSTTIRIAISEAVAEAADLPAPRPVVIPNCVDDPGPGPLARPADDPGLRFVVASRWNRWKGHATLLKAWNAAGCPGTLEVLGGPPPIGDAVDVPALVEQYVSRPSTVVVVGEVADAGPYIAAADVLLLPSDEPEPFGLVVIEAFARSRPVIASRAGGPLEIITDGHDGWVYEPGDHLALAALLKRVDRAAAADAGVRARDTFEQRYSAPRYRSAIGELIASRMADADR